jgi:hypothetical protein
MGKDHLELRFTFAMDAASIRETLRVLDNDQLIELIRMCESYLDAEPNCNESCDSCPE